MAGYLDILAQYMAHVSAAVEITVRHLDSVTELVRKGHFRPCSQPVVGGR